MGPYVISRDTRTHVTILETAGVRAWDEYLVFVTCDRRGLGRLMKKTWDNIY